MSRREKRFKIKKILIMFIIISMLIPGVGNFGGFDSASAAGENLALNKPATASASSPGSGPELTVDGNSTTRWSSGEGYNGDQWLCVDLGSAQNINHVVIKWETAYTTSYIIQGSNDGSSWTNLYNGTNAAGLTNPVSDVAFSSAGARYVRIYCNGSGQTTWYGFSIWELEVYGSDTVSGNLALNKPATASVSYPGSGPELTVDGSTSTRWSSGEGYNGDQWLRVDLGSTQNVSRVVIKWETAYTTSYIIQGSNNGSSWTNLYNGTNATGLTNPVSDVTFTTAGVRYVRVYCNGSGQTTWYGFSIWEFEVYGGGGTPPPNPRPDPPAGLIANWKFDEGTGSTAVDSVAGKNANISNATWAAGKFGGALSFNGSNSTVAVSSNVGTLSNFTVAMWVNMRSAPNAQNALMAYNGWNTGDFEWLIGQTDRNMTSRIVGAQTFEDPTWGSASSTLGSFDSGKFNSWHHVVLSYTTSWASGKPGMLRFYVDGALDKEVTIKGNPIPGAVLGPLQIGGSNLGGKTFDGLIDDVQIYNRVLSDDEIGTLYAGRLPAVITGTTSKQATNVFKKNEAATATINITRINTGVPGQTLAVVIKDVNGNTISSQNLPVTPDGSGNWTSSTITLPTADTGYYYLTAQLTTGEKLKKVGTRPAAILPYIVVVDPALRTPGTENSFFGMEGYSSAIDLTQYLGMNSMQNPLYDWSHMEVNGPDEFEWRLANGLVPEPDPNKFEKFTFSSFPTWATETGSGYGKLTPAGETAFYDYNVRLGQYINSKLPNRTRHVYQIGWEPVYPWHWDNSDPGTIVKMISIAYQGLHAGDPKAFVIAPTYAGMDGNHLNWVDQLFQLGLANWFDGYSNHSYVSQPPELIPAGGTRNFKGWIDDTKAKIQYYKGTVSEIWGTEQGVSTQDDFERELSSAPMLIRTNLIALGEGMKSNDQFAVNDYLNEQGFGFFHNLDPVTYEWVSNVISPKPIAAAYANMTYLLEGFTSTGLIGGMPSGTMGYTYTRGGSTVKAVWDYSGANQTVNIPVSGVSQVTVYDWMGKTTTKTVSGGNVSITLGKNPQYIKY